MMALARAPPAEVPHAQKLLEPLMALLGRKGHLE